MSLPNKAIDRLFERLAASYGAGWTRQWADVPMIDVKTAWSYELAGYATNLDAVAWALDNLPEYCPNAIQFRGLCRAAPAPASLRLPEPKADPARLRSELAKLGHVRATAAQPHQVDNRAWARRIVERHGAGDAVGFAALRVAREALGVANA